jgi:peptidoglycan/LPS O-acetylase OafA/YrhL
MEKAQQNAKFLPALESLRGLAAVYVILHHISSNFLGLQQTLIGQPFRFGQEAVMVFFILSGFVICYSTEARKSISWKAYVWLRIRRIYPIFIIALILAYSVACIGSKELIVPDWTQLLGNLAMLHDLGNKPGVWVRPFLGNSPLWSLSYEMTFYLLYIPLMIFVGKSFQLRGVALISWGAVAINQIAPNPWCNFASFFIIWWVGVEMARQFREEGTLSLKKQIHLSLYLLPSFLFYMVLCWDLGWHGSKAAYPFYQARFYGAAMGALLIIPAIQNSPLRHIGKSKLLLWIGSISYSLYAFHYPIICKLPTMPRNFLALDLGLKIVGLVLLAWFAERKLQPWINKHTTFLFREKTP